MDEVSLLVSQRLEALQIRTLSSLDAARVLFRGHLQNGIIWLNDVWAGERAQVLREAALQLQVWSLETYSRARESISQMNYEEVVQRLRQIYLSEFAGPQVYWCSFGAVSGITLGRRWHPAYLHPPGMRAVVCKNSKGIDGVTMVEDAPSPTITRSDQIIIQVRCTSIDPVDIKVCNGYGHVLRKHLGKYHPEIPNKEHPLVLGRDGSGVVVEVGDDVKGFSPGDEVWFAIPPWAPRGGTMSQLLLIMGVGEIGGDKIGLERGHAVAGLWGTVIAHKPRGVGFEGASTIPFSACTAWEAVTVGARLAPDTTPGKRFDVVFNTVGPVLLEECLNSCKDEDPGRGIPAGIMVNAYARPIASDSRGIILGAICSIWACIRALILSSLELDGRSVGWVGVNTAKEALTQFGRLIEEGRIIPVVGKIFSVGDAEMAFQHADTTDPLGKTVIRFSKVASTLYAARSGQSTPNGSLSSRSAWLLKE
ncbi:hypothetical protein J437_LFUL002210 [Ladona fulva]|uniref:Enoyl reductase (ER) domain-containing protein n=1 Tax=Ladona fulva TaxID=123851 RepID=A0A8K0NWZ2_LADFU|nr:hypothetical protein J437_LFUL002210 [Ladona fulva]